MLKRLLSLIFLLLSLPPVAIFAQQKPSPKKDAPSEAVAPTADHHQHLFSPAYVALQSPGTKTISAREIIELLDQAGIRRAALLSTGYRYGRPGAEVPNEYAAVKAENDWTAAQAALYPKRLVAFCGFNPLKDYALEELARCGKTRNPSRGIKMHFGNSDVQLEDPEHFEKLKRIFQAANKERLAIVVHMRASISKKRPYGPEQARRFLELLAFAPDIPVQIAHLASAGPGFVDPPAHSVLEVLAEAVAKKDSRTKNLWFDAASNAHPDNPAEINALLVRLIRRIGVKRILYGTDAATGDNLRPRESWQAFTRIGLSPKELKTVARNVAPYLR